MNRIIETNLPEIVPDFIIMQKCFNALSLPYKLVFAGHMEKYVNNNNVFFLCMDSEMKRYFSIEKACNALHRLILNFKIINQGII